MTLIWKPAPEGMPSASSRDSGREAPLITMGLLQGRGQGRQGRAGRWVQLRRGLRAKRAAQAKGGAGSKHTWPPSP